MIVWALEELLQLVYCGGGLRYRDAPNRTKSNASRFYVAEVASRAWSIERERSQMRQDFTTELLQPGLVGFGNVGMMSLIRRLPFFSYA